MPKEIQALAAGKKIKQGDYTKTNLMHIVEWKAARAKGWFKDNKQRDLNDILSTAMNGLSDLGSIAILTGLKGVRIPMASAILTAIHPRRFTVIDKYALQALGTKQTDITPAYYVEYLNFCRKKARQYDVSLRNFDRALWQSQH
jgi:hypothetical protein